MCFVLAQTEVDSSKAELESHRHTGLSVFWIPIAGWITAGVMISKMDALKEKIGGLNNIMEDVRQDINLHNHYSVLYEWFSIEHGNMQSQISWINERVGLTENLDIALTNDNSYWKKVARSYAVIRTKVRVFQAFHNFKKMLSTGIAFH